jgi:O-antigen ligase
MPSLGRSPVLSLGRTPAVRAVGGHEATTSAGLVSADARLAGRVWPARIAWWMAALYVALHIIRPWEQLFPILGTIHFERLFAVVMILLVAATARLRSDTIVQNVHYPPGVFSFTSVSVLGFLVALLLCTVFADDPARAWDAWYSFFTLVVFYFVLLLVIRTPYELVLMVSAYLAAMTVYLAKSQWEYFLNDRHRIAMGVRRLIGIDDTFGGPNSLAISIVVSLPFLLFLFVYRKQIWATWPALWRQIFLVSLFGYGLFCASSIIMTRSRSGMVSGILFVGMVAMRGKGAGRKLASVMGGLVLLAVLWVTMSQEAKDRLRTVWNPQAGPANATESAEGRIEGLRAGVQMFAAQPLTGVGPGNFVPYRVTHLDGVPLESHNLAGQLLGETGILGTVSFSLFVTALLLNCRRIRRRARQRTGPAADVLSGFAVACRDATVLLLFEGLFGHNLLRFNWLWLAAFTVLSIQFVNRLPPAVRQSLARSPWPRSPAPRTVGG